MPSRPASLPLKANAPFVAKVVKQPLNLIGGKGGKNLLEVTKRAAVGVVLADVFDEEFLVRLVIKTPFAGVCSFGPKDGVKPT